MADKILWYKYIVKNVARSHGKTATFMPKPLFGDNGSGMHTHQSLWKGEKPLFAGDGYAGLSDMALYYIGGILKHAAAVCAFANPTTNSYRRLVPGYEAPVNLAYSARNRSAAVPHPDVQPVAQGQAHRVPLARPELQPVPRVRRHADGRARRHPEQDPSGRRRSTRTSTRCRPRSSRKCRTCPGSLDEALDALRRDHAFLLKGDVFTPDVIDTWIGYKSEKEVDEIRLRPTPAEFALYFDC